MLEVPACWNSESSGFSKSRCMHRGHQPQLGSLIVGKMKNTIHTRADEVPVTSVQEGRTDSALSTRWTAVVGEKMLPHVMANMSFALTGQHAGASGLSSCYPTGKRHKSRASGTTLYTFLCSLYHYPRIPWLHIIRCAHNWQNNK